MFEAPEIIKRIPDIRQIYEINDIQETNLDGALAELEGNIFIESMSEEMTGKWEKILKLAKAEGDRLEDRRSRVKAKILERLPYSQRVITGKIKGICVKLYDISINDDRTEMEIVALFDGTSQIEIMEEMLENSLPLNMIYLIRARKESDTLTHINIGGIIASKQKKRYIEWEENK